MGEYSSKAHAYLIVKVGETHIKTKSAETGMK